MKTGSLFSGYGGLDMAARQVFGGTVAWTSDNHPSAVKTLAHHYPGVPNYGDITAIDWHEVEPVDVLCAGFPCQDISNAGKRAGIEGARSGLWSYVADAVRVLRPRHVVLENVAALLVRGLDRVAADLAEVGYDLRWTCVRASDVGAPHRRERWFGLAEPAAGDTSLRGRHVAPVAAGRGEPAGATGGPGLAAAHATGNGHGDAGTPGVGGLPAATVAGDQREAAPNADRGGLGAEQCDLRTGQSDADRFPAADAANHRREELHDSAVGDATRGGRVRNTPGGPGLPPVDWGQYEAAICRWEHVLGRPAPAPTVDGRRGNRVLSPLFVEWLMGLPAGHVTAVPDLSRNDQLRLLGNGVVPQQGTAALRWLLTSTAQESAA